MSKITCKNIHLRRMNGMWWCIAPYDPTILEQALMGTGSTPADAYRDLIDLLATPDFVPPPSTPRSRELHRRWDEAERRQQNGMHRPWSSLDCAVRNGGPWL